MPRDDQWSSKQNDIDHGLLRNLHNVKFYEVSVNSVRHHAQRPLSLISSARSYRRTRGRLQVAPEGFFKTRLLEAEKGVGHRHQADVMMPAQPLADLVMAHLQFPFQFAIVLFDPPA